MRNQQPAAAALEIAASTLIRDPTVGPIGSSETARPTITNSGLPGGCGRPKVYAAAMYSLVSHIAVDGASVRRYSPSTHAATIPAARYGGRSPRESLRSASSPQCQINSG